MPKYIDKTYKAVDICAEVNWKYCPKPDAKNPDGSLKYGELKECATDYILDLLDFLRDCFRDKDNGHLVDIYKPEFRPVLDYSNEEDD